MIIILSEDCFNTRKCSIICEMKSSFFSNNKTLVQGLIVGLILGASGAFLFTRNASRIDDYEERYFKKLAEISLLEKQLEDLNLRLLALTYERDNMSMTISSLNDTISTLNIALMRARAHSSEFDALKTQVIELEKNVEEYLYLITNVNGKIAANVLWNKGVIGSIVIWHESSKELMISFRDEYERLGGIILNLFSGGIPKELTDFDEVLDSPENSARAYLFPTEYTDGWWPCLPDTYNIDNVAIIFVGLNQISIDSLDFDKYNSYSGTYYYPTLRTLNRNSFHYDTIWNFST